MTKSRVICCIIFLYAVIVSGCETSEKDKKPTGADISFTYGQFGYESYGSPSVEVVLKHNGGKDIYNASCDVKAIRGSAIVDTGFAYFADGATIKAGQSTTDKAIFFDLSSHEDYTTVESECDWLYR